MKNDNSLAFQLWGGYFSTFPRVPGHRKTTPQIAEYYWGNTKKNMVFSKRSKKKGKKQTKRKKAKGGKNEKGEREERKNKKKKKKKKEEEKGQGEEKPTIHKNSRSSAPVAAAMLSSR